MGLGEEGLAANKVIHVYDDVEALVPHQPGNSASDADTRRPRGPAPEGQDDVDVAPPVDYDAEEGQGDRVNMKLAVGPRDPLALLDEAPSEDRHAREAVGVWDAEVFPPRNTCVHTDPGVDFGLVMMGLHWARGVKGRMSNGPTGAPFRS